MKIVSIVFIQIFLIIWAPVKSWKSTVIIDNDNNNQNVVNTPMGTILGSTDLKTRLNKTIYSFRGIRYAKAPIGERRFQPPVPVDPWFGETFNATTEGPACFQPSEGLEQSEDCLRLNVYTLKLPQYEETPQQKAVLVYIHAGGFYSVSGQSLFEGPQYLLDSDIVLVTINYRLGSLGFLSTGDAVQPGNLGLKDQVAALRWVRGNIASFGGDPNKVTICGYSAGGFSVGLHLVSPMSKGLFHRAIAMSGSPVGQFKLPKHQFEIAQKQARLNGCPSNTSQEIIDCLRTIPAGDITYKFSDFQEVGSDPVYIWYPVIEPVHDGERFLTDDPNKLILEGKYSQVPFMSGVTEHEFAYKAYYIVENETLTNFWNGNFNYAAPIAFLYERNTTKSEEISNEFKQFYLGNDTIQNSTVTQFGEAYADSFGFSVNRLVNLVAKTNTYPVYYYKFAYKGMDSHFYLPGSKKPIGPVHHDDLIYLFYISVLFPMFGPSDPAVRTVERMTKLWSNFAKHGNPTPQKDETTDSVIWEPFTVENKKFANIQCRMEMKNDMFAERYNLWNKLFPIPK